MSKDAIRKAADENVDLIPYPFDEIYKSLGYDSFAVLFDHFGGQSVYVPTMRKVLSDAIKSQALKECKVGLMSSEQVAKKYGYTPRYFKKILNS